MRNNFFATQDYWLLFRTTRPNDSGRLFFSCPATCPSLWSDTRILKRRPTEFNAQKIIEMFLFVWNMIVWIKIRTLHEVSLFDFEIMDCVNFVFDQNNKEESSLSKPFSVCLSGNIGFFCMLRFHFVLIENSSLWRTYERFKRVIINVQLNDN